MYSKVNFIVPVNSDTVLKIKDIKGVVAHIIRDHTCTIKRAGRFIHIKQSGDANEVVLDFNSESESEDAHLLLRTALVQMGNNVDSKDDAATTIDSPDIKNESPVFTNYDGDDAGISELADDPIGSVKVFVNGLNTVVGNGCNKVSFLNPTFECLFAARYEILEINGRDYTLANSAGITANDFFIVKIGQANDIARIVSVKDNIIRLDIDAVPTDGFGYKPKTYNNIGSGDRLIWFGSFAEYQLDPTDRITYSYLVKT
jgi:hypothetical protein